MDLKTLRRSKQITQRELADKCGISWQLISMIERGKRNVTVKNAKRLAAVLDIDWTEFFKESA